MDRAAFNRCLGQGLKGKKFPSKEARRAEFCVLAKTCSHPGMKREEAVTICIRKHPEWKPLLEGKDARR